MTSERVQRQIDRLLNEAEEAIRDADWPKVRLRVGSILALDPENQDAISYLEAAGRASPGPFIGTGDAASSVKTRTPAPEPASFVAGRYQVKRFLGEGGKKKVYLAHDVQLDRDVAFALIKTEGLDDAGRERVTREAQAMGRLGSHPHIVTVYDIGEESGQPYLVLPLLPGGDIEGVIEKAPDHRLPLDRLLKIGIESCQGLEYAHSKGIIHRDLKPGNVWLAEDGRAMIGDFGLAVAVDRSRLTQAGVMVGTVSYMPPEQAIGGEVTARSDLYSLGAMLYEMVCGRPPFIGDESVAIIGQHLNTPPIAPSWHRPDCPPGLEALILRLLEKDSSKRPASAAEVKQALEAVNTGARPATTAAADAESPHVPDPLYRGTFVGREPELRQLHAAFDAAVSGQGGLVTVVGEPGIGKTALCQQLETYAAMRGGRALVGHCYEEGSLSLPYLAFVEAMRSYVLEREPGGLKTDLGTGAADVARIVSEVRDRVHGVELRQTGDPEDDRWRLLQAVTSFLRNAASVQPLVIVLEDLHWADRGTLDLLLHIARNLQGARLLLVGTYRDVEVDRAHPLSATLAELRRIGSFSRIPLRGLTVEEVHRMYTAIRGQEVPRAQSEAVHRQTEGNPLFVQEVLRYLVEEGYVVREAGRWVLAEGTEPGTGIPEGLRDVVGKRLNRLSEKTNQVLSIAAVMGREFRLDVLQQVSGLPEDEVFAAVEEASERAVVEQRQVLGAVAFRFTHAFFRQTLYEEMFAPRRIRLHQQVGRALEAVHARRLEEHAAELAEHFAQSTEAEDLQKALHYCELAAQKAISVFAYSDAVHQLEQALRALDVLDPDDQTQRCDLLLALGEAMLPAGQSKRVFDEVAEAAFTIAERLAQPERAVRAYRLADHALGRYGAATSTLIPAGIRWAARGERYGVRMLDLNDPIEKRIEALESARKSGNSALFLATAGPLMGGVPPHRWAAALALAEECEALPREGLGSDRLLPVLRALASCGNIQLVSGNREHAERNWREVKELGQRIRDPQFTLLELGTDIYLSLLDGELEQGIRIGTQLLERGEAIGSPLWAYQFSYENCLRLRLLLGRADEALEILEKGHREFGIDPTPVTLRGGVVAASRALCLAHLGRYEEARELLESAIERLGIDETPKSGTTTHLVNFLETAVLVRHRELAALLANRLAAISHLLGPPPQSLVCIARLLGGAAKLLGRLDDARRYYAQALEVCEKVRFRPEIALIRLELAELLLEHYPDERSAAIEHLDFAIGEFRDMKMQPSLERALGHRELLKA